MRDGDTRTLDMIVPKREQDSMLVLVLAFPKTSIDLFASTTERQELLCCCGSFSRLRQAFAKHTYRVVQV